MEHLTCDPVPCPSQSASIPRPLIVPCEEHIPHPKASSWAPNASQCKSNYFIPTSCSFAPSHGHHEPTVPENCWVCGVEVPLGTPCTPSRRRASSAASSLALLTCSPEYQFRAGIAWPLMVTVQLQAVRPPNPWAIPSATIFVQ